MTSGADLESVLSGLARCREAAVSAGGDLLVYFIDMAIAEARNITSMEQHARPSARLTKMRE
jgi:hypothetical protein